MRRRMIVVVLLLCLPMVGEGQDFIRYYPPSGAAGLTSNGTVLTSTVPLLLPDGSAAAPTLSFSGETNTGFWRAGGGQITWTIGGTYRGKFTATALEIVNTSSYVLLSDVYIQRDAANNLQIGIDAATAAAQTISAADSSGAAQPGAQLNLSGGTGGAGGEPGAVAITDGGTKPTCAVGIRGSIWYDAGGAGVADTFEVCAKAAADSYAWRVLATIP